MLAWKLFVSLALLILPSSSAAERRMVSYDLIIRGARLIDGTGSPWIRTDVGLSGELIGKVGRMTESELELAGEVLEAEDRFLAPGFIDSHTHDDIALHTTPTHPSKTLQGVTTVVTGSCSFSNYPNGENDEVQTHLSSLLGQISPSHFFHNLSSLGEELGRVGVGPNVASLVGHGPIRISVMGYENRKASPEEILEMSSLLEAQLIQGAVGLSLGLVYPPSAYAGHEELLALAKVIVKHDRLISAHIRSYEGNLLTSIEEFLLVLEQSGARGLLSHLQVAGTPYWDIIMPQALERLEIARASGIDVTIDMYPYTAGSSSILQLLPPSALSGGFEALEERLLNDPTYYDILQELTESGAEPGWESKIALIGWENVMLNSVVSEELGSLGVEGLNLREGMEKLGYHSEFSFTVMVVLMDKGRSNIIMFQQAESDLARVFQSRLQSVGSDSIPREGGKPHPRMYGSFPKVIGRMVQEQGLLPLEEAVRKSTSLTATRFGILDRGLIRPGMAADLVLFSTEILDEATYEEPTLSSKGIDGVWVNGVRVVENGEALPNLPGRLLLAN
jgi:N-acyl-D-amino-acid deacylase